MDTERHHIQVRGIPVEVLRKDIKNLHLAVYPPSGRVRISVPRHITDDAVRLAVIDRLPWIHKQQAKFSTQDRQSQREMLTGESHYYQGRRYRLDVIEHNAPATVKIINNTTIQLMVRPGSNRQKREEVLLQWYREGLRDQIPPLIEKWEPVMGVQVADWGIKRMKTRWGSCNIRAHRIWINLELAKKPAYCLEYVLVHEMVHLLERLHNKRFQMLMDKFMPHWRMQRDALNRAPLCHEDWGY